MTVMKNSSLPAMPTENSANVSSGMTKRERFVMAAMQGVISSDVNNYFTAGNIADQAVDIADRALAKLEEGQ